MWGDLSSFCGELALVFYLVFFFAVLKWIAALVSFPSTVEILAVGAFGWSSSFVYACTVTRSIGRVFERSYKAIVSKLANLVKLFKNGDDSADERNNIGVNLNMLCAQFVFTISLCLLVTGIERLIQYADFSLNIRQFVMTTHDYATKTMLITWAVKAALEIGLLPVLSGFCINLGTFIRR